jgi:hypothetical protein
MAVSEPQRGGIPVAAGASRWTFVQPGGPSTGCEINRGRNASVILQHIAGRAWISEDDHQLARLEAEVIEPISIGAGLLAKLQTGSTLRFERRKVNDEIWLPVRAEASISGRMLLLKGLNMREVTEFSDHQKYSVDTTITFGDAPLKSKPR